ncbi:vomeronasal type-2 receptor 26-like [Protopterus annectens]|uniref:vomeronasal type-2 receptor 26-like n=1 Tax=Protopterus annectens TaxID=7888 RepID=UPI001CFAC10F|nr:vomeronasal type-2 receptor 26-like [Protopterus annectens]
MVQGAETIIPSSVCSESCTLGYRKMIRKGQPICCFDCVPCSQGEIANTTGSTSCFKCPEDHWSNERHDACILKTIEFLSYNDPLGTSLAAAAISLTFISLSFLLIFIKYRNTPIVKANNRELSYFLLASLQLCFLCSLMFIGHPVNITCILRQTVFGSIFSMSVSLVLSKTVTVVIAFKATHPSSVLHKWFGSNTSTVIVFFCTLGQIIICAVWLANAPPFVETNTWSLTNIIIIECNEGNRMYFYLILGYMGSLASVCFVLAFLARKLPDTFNEAKYITFSMLIFVSVWLSFIPAYLSTQGKNMVAVEIFAILSSSLGLLICIFLSKCYIILLKPEMNTRKHIRGK